VIRTFADKRSAALFEGRFIKGVPTAVAQRATRKLATVDAAHTLEVLRAVPGNRLELLRGDRTGQYSIRVNEQWRICFRWRDGDAHDVEFCDYH
jgi:proteic killer suppression protein